jgi:Flp pilus assembly protein TadG
VTRLFGRSRAGQGIVELAIILPVCLWVLLGIIDFGRAFHFYTAATNAAREGARYWVSNPTASSATVVARVQAEALPQVTVDPARVTLSSPSQQERRVQVQYEFTAITPLISSLWGGGNLLMTTWSVMPTLQN